MSASAIQQVYVAMFGRPADPVGLQFWLSVTNQGTNLAPLIDNLASSTEYQARFSGQSPAQQVNSIYLSLFNRPAEIEGLLFWSNKLASGEISLAQIAVVVSQNASTADAAIVANKVTAAAAFTAALDTAAEVTAYVSGPAFDSARSFIAGVSTTAPDAAAVTAAVTAATTGGVPGGTLTFTDGVDDLVGTANNDTFQASLLAGAETLTLFDKANGAGGTDTLNVLLDTADTALAAGISISGIEIVNLISNGTGTLGAVGLVDASVFGGATQVWQVNAAQAGVTEVGAGTAVGFRNIATLNSTVETAADVTSATVVLDNVDTSASLDFLSADQTAFTVSGSLEDSTTLAVANAGGGLEQAVLALTGDNTVDLSSVTTLTSVDASTSTGDLTINASALVALEVLNGGSGSDELTVNFATLTSESVAISAGAGNDVVLLDPTAPASANVAVTVTLGAGNDTVEITALANIFDADEADFAGGIITISDFSTAGDVLDISALGAISTLTNTEIANIQGESTLFDALGVAAGLAKNLFAFEYGGNTYVYQDAGVAGDFDTGDGLVQLTGVSVGALSGSNFVTA